jgi:peptidoglycan/xylan/chitin deacetylase (PgdA/CDA1 family)
MYHDVVGARRAPSGRKGAGPDRYKLDWGRFVDHLDRIEQVVGVPPALLDDAGAGEDGSPTWALTFDDGGSSALDVGEELSRRNWRGYFFVTTGFVGRDGFVDEAAILELDRMGHLVGSHSVTHPGLMGALPADALQREWDESVATLSELLGRPVRTASVPGGYYRRRVALAAVRAGITTLFTSEPVRTGRWVDGCLVVGRFSVLQALTADEAAQAAAGKPGPWARQYVGWNLRKPVKALAGERYNRVRRALLARSSQPTDAS